MKIFRFVVLLIILQSLLPPAAFVQSWLAPLECVKTPIPKDRTSGSGYTAIECGLDGTVYIGTAWYGFSGYLLAYDYKTRQFRTIAHLEDIVHQFERGINAHGKTHTRFRIGQDGKIYGGTKHGYEIFNTRPEFGESYNGYPGGHLYCYDPAIDKVTDLGIPFPQEGFMSICLDDKRGRIYGIEDPNYHFVMYDLKTGEGINLGPPGNYISCRYMAIDDEGFVYHPGEPGYWVIFDPEKEELIDVPLKVEGISDYAHPYAMNVGPKGSHRIYAIMNSTPARLIEYVTSRKDTITVREIPLKEIGGLPGGITGGSTIALGKDNKMYWTCGFKLEGDKDYRLALFSYDPATGKARSYGHLTGEGKPLFTGGVQGSVLDTEGNWHAMAHRSFVLPNYPYSVVTVQGLASK